MLSLCLEGASRCHSWILRVPMAVRRRLAVSRGGACWVGFFFLVSCECSPPTKESSFPLARQTTARSEEPIILESAAPLDPTLAEDVTWRRSADGDPMDCARLGEREGAARLLSRVAAGGRAGVVALCALPWAPDAHAHRRRLCELLGRLDGEGRALGLEALKKVLNGARFGEQLDAEADASCLQRLRALGESVSSPEQRDLVQSLENQLTWSAR